MIGVEKKGAIRYWAKSNSKKDRDVALQLLLIYCIYCIHPLCNFRTPTWLSHCWQFDLLRHVFAGLTYQSKRCNKKYCASPYWDVRHVWCRVMNCVCAWTLRPMPIWRMPMYASSVQVCQLYHVISLMYNVYLCILMLSQVICPVKKSQGDRMECCGTRVQDHGQWRSGLGASWTSTGSFHPTSDAYPPYPACSTGRLAHGISTTASKWSLPLAQRKKAVLQKKTFKCHLNADIDEVWKSTSFDRMQAAMRTFAVDDTSARSLEGRNAMGKNLEFQGYISKFFSKVLQ